MVFPSNAIRWLSRLAATMYFPFGLAAMPHGPIWVGILRISARRLPASA